MRQDGPKGMPPGRAPAERSGGDVFAEDHLLAELRISAFGIDKDLEQWLRSFIVVCISNSPCSAIRTCAKLASCHHPLASKLFRPAFLSCWKRASSAAKEQITEWFKELICADGIYEPVARELLGLLLFMEKVGQPLNISSNDVVAASLAYGEIAYALHTQQRLYEQAPDNIEVIRLLIDVLVQLGDRASATGVWNRCKGSNASLNEVAVLARLRMWDKVELVYRERFERRYDFESFLGLSRGTGHAA